MLETALMYITYIIINVVIINVTVGESRDRARAFVCVCVISRVEEEDGDNMAREWVSER